SPEIVHIDITDAALQQVHAWPWPRRLHAELIDLLNQLGARTIALDIVFAEPTPPRLELPQLSPDYDLEPEVAVRGQPSLDQAIYDDDELAEAIRRAGNVYLPVYFRLRRPPESRLQRDVAALLRQDFSLGLEAIAQRLGQRPALIDRILAGVKRRVADELVRTVLQEQPQATIQQVHRAILSSPFELPTADRQDIFRAYRRQRATAQILRRSQPLPQHAHAVLPAAYELTPPLPKLLSAARGVGFVVFEPDRDGVVRRLPLLVRYRGRLLKQLGLAVACDRLGIADRDIRVAGGKLLLRPPGRADLNVPLDATGRYLINWAGPPSHWSKVFTHIPVGRIMEIAANRRTIRQNNQQLRFDLAEMVRLFTPQAYADYASQVRRRNQILRQLDRTPRRTADPPDRPALQAELDALESRIARLEDNARYVLRQYYSAAQAHSPADQQEQRLFQAAQRLYPRIIQGQLRRQIARANGRLQLRIDQRMAELRPLIEGKICLVGYTASAVADFKSTPLFENTPG
ncbi:MAG: CHASE2 domain-containing protein, partial [Phycisphaerae bacterium]